MSDIKIMVTGDGYIPEGTVVTAAYIDEDGDARLKEEDANRYLTSWVFKNNFTVVDEVKEPEGQNFEIILTVEGAQSLGLVLSELSDYVDIDLSTDVTIKQV